MENRKATKKEALQAVDTLLSVIKEHAEYNNLRWDMQDRYRDVPGSMDLCSLKQFLNDIIFAE